jgi:hypothetical protein
MLMASTSQNYSSQKIPPVTKVQNKDYIAWQAGVTIPGVSILVLIQKEAFNFITYGLAEIALVFCCNKKKTIIYLDSIIVYKSL